MEAFDSFINFYSTQLPFSNVFHFVLLSLTVTHVYRIRNRIKKKIAANPISFSNFQIPYEYYYNKSTEDNYYCKNNDEAIKSADRLSSYHLERETLDYSYHKCYSHERQQFQDSLMNTFFDTFLKNTGLTPASRESWLVFTAGPMGAGKSHTIGWLDTEGLFPLQSFLKVDPDIIRELLPETFKYNQMDPLTAGKFTQKEVGYISEVSFLSFMMI